MLTIELDTLRLGFLLGTIGFLPNSLLNIIPGGFSSDVSIFNELCSRTIKESHCYSLGGENDIDQITARYYDVITFFDTLSQFKDLAFLKDLQCSYVIVTVPWYHPVKNHDTDNEDPHRFTHLSLIKLFLNSNYTLKAISSIEDVLLTKSSPLQTNLTGIFKKNDSKNQAERALAISH